MTPVEIKQFRSMLKMTQRELANHLGMTVQQISNYETGHSPAPKVVELALLYLSSMESYDDSAFFADWNRADMEAYDAL